MQQFQRAAMLLGEKGLETLAQKRVAVFGIGGVGSFTVEALARCGLGGLLLVDNDTISETNINRQLHSTYETLGQYKTKVMAGRVATISPSTQVETKEVFVLPDNLEQVLSGSFDYLVDAIDTVSGKIALAQYGANHGIPVISCMGAGNKLDPTQFRVGDLFSTSICPLCRVMRKELRKRGVEQLKVVYSTEEPIPPDVSVLSPEERSQTQSRRGLPGSVSFVPPVAGMIAAGEVIKDLLAEQANNSLSLG